MIGKSIRLTLALGAVVAAGFGVACGSDDSSSSPAASYENIVGEIESPTGTLDTATATPVAEEFAKVSSSGLGGNRQVQGGQDVSAQVCTAGGSATADGAGTSSSGNMTVNYNGCCIEQGCCIDGTVSVLFNSDTSSTSGYSQCMNYDVSLDCAPDSATIKAAGCLNGSGEFVYSIHVNGESYSVSGSYSDGNGTLTIIGANGTWTCTYTDGSGTCTGTSGEFTF